MIICRKCSRRHPDGTEFCTCGAFLEFDGERVTDAAGAPPAPSDRPKPAADPLWSSTMPKADTEGTGTREPAPWSGFTTGESAASSATKPIPFDAQLPDTPAAPSAEPVWVEPTARAGDITCRSCGSPNAPDRQFCHHCGQPLHGPVAATTAPTARLPWWRRFGRRARERAARTDPMALAGAAQRVARGGVSWRSLAFRTGGALVLVVALLALLGPWRSTVVAKAKDLLGANRYEVLGDGDVEAISVASSPAIEPQEFPLQPPENVVDDFANTAWATRWLVADAVGLTTAPADDSCSTDVWTDSFLRFTFPAGADLDRIRILGGRYAGDPARDAFSRPRFVEVRRDDDCELIELPDDGELAMSDYEHDDVQQVELRVVGIHPGSESLTTVEISAVVFEHGR